MPSSCRLSAAFLIPVVDIPDQIRAGRGQEPGSLDRYHFDLDDWHALKFFFYLTDVDQDSGPHVYVVGSHRRRSLKHQLTLLVGHPADEIVGFYGPDSLLTITGPAGKGFVEDPFGFHMGTVPNKAPRLMMEVGFGVSRPLRRDLHEEPVLRPWPDSLRIR